MFIEHKNNIWIRKSTKPLFQVEKSEWHTSKTTRKNFRKSVAVKKEKNICVKAFLNLKNISFSEISKYKKQFFELWIHRKGFLCIFVSGNATFSLISKYFSFLTVFTPDITWLLLDETQIVTFKN